MLKTIVAFRYVLLIAALGAVIGAAILFWIAGSKIVGAAGYVFVSGDTKLAIANILSATDAFIFGIVLVVFATGITFGFVFQLEPEQERQLPSWMRVHGIHDLKQKLVEVIILYLIVDFATDWIDDGTPRDWLFLAKPASILLLAAAVRLLQRDVHEN